LAKRPEESAAMTPEQKQLVRETWKQIAPTAEEAADLFYCRLFDTDPSTRELFSASDMFAQRKKLLQTLGFAISSLDNLDVLMSMLQALGRRHVGYGVTAKQYESVGVALLWALERSLGPAWTPAAAAAWAEVYTLLSRVMRGAAVDASPRSA
jgi:hemoglobin-like flavoprotein